MSLNYLEVINQFLEFFPFNLNTIAVHNHPT